MDVRTLPEEFDAACPLRSDLLTLTPMGADDLPALTLAAGDPGIWVGHPDPGRWQAEVFATYVATQLAAGGAMTLRKTVEREAAGRVIGMSRFYATSDTPNGICIGYTFLTRDHWGGGTNFELKRLMLDHLFGSVPEAWFHIGQSNIRSQRATAKLGAERMETMRLDLGAGPAEWVRMRLDHAVWRARLAV